MGQGHRSLFMDRLRFTFEGKHMQPITRRKFSEIISAAGFAGTALLERMYGEMQDGGAISPDNVRTFLAMSGTTIPDDQIATVQASLERAIDSMKRIRDRSVPQNREPVVTFRVRR